MAQVTSVERGKRYWAVNLGQDGNELWDSIANGRLPIPWPQLGTTDLHVVRAKRESGGRLTKVEKEAWRFRRLADPNIGPTAGDVLLIPRLPFDSLVTVALTKSDYAFSPDLSPSHGYEIEVLSDVLTVEADDDFIPDGLRRSLRSPGKLWCLDRFSDDIEVLIGAINEERRRTLDRREALSAFFRNNPESVYEVENGYHYIARPWADETLKLLVVTDDPEFERQYAQILNGILLPSRLTAIYHRQRRDLEVIYAPVAPDDETRERKFDFHYGDAAYSVEFADSSPVLQFLAGLAVAVLPPSSTGHRNLIPFRELLRTRSRGSNAERAATPDLVPTSFWIRGIEWDEEFVLEFVRHLNFYMRYFDLQTPHILVHDEHAERTDDSGPARFPFGEFPKSIMGRPLDQYLTGLAHTATTSSDRFTSFIYAYQILEYAGFYHLQDAIERDVRRILAAPDALSRPTEATREILDLLAEDRSSPEDKMTALFRQLVSPSAVWRQIEANRSYFAADVEFDGGFQLPALIREEWNLSDFEAAWLPKFPDQLRKLRNALVHSREARQSRGLAPTISNHERIEPWLGPLWVAAMQVVVNRDVA
jgi:hypothetical protein